MKARGVLAQARAETSPGLGRRERLVRRIAIAGGVLRFLGRVPRVTVGGDQLDFLVAGQRARAVVASAMVS